VSTSAGTSGPENGHPAAAPRPLIDRPYVRVLLLAAVLLAAFGVSRSCGSPDKEIAQDEAVEIATEAAAFEPCDEPGCVVVRYVQRGIPVHGFWLVGLSDNPNPKSEGARFQSFLVDAETGDVTRA
jgi:hypothetical protein